MFKKADSEPVRSEPVTATRTTVSQPGAQAMIGESIVMKGELSGEEDLVIHGRIEGTINLKTNSVTIGKGGRVKADVNAKTITIEGEMQGDLVAEECIVVKQSGHVQGNLVAPRVILEDGARFKGSIDMEQSSVATSGKPRAVEPQSQSQTPPQAQAKAG